MIPVQFSVTWQLGHTVFVSALQRVGDGVARERASKLYLKFIFCCPSVTTAVLIFLAYVCKKVFILIDAQIHYSLLESQYRAFPINTRCQNLMYARLV